MGSVDVAPERLFMGPRCRVGPGRVTAFVLEGWQSDARTLALPVDASQRRQAVKKFSCGSVIPDCQATFRAESEDALLAQIQKHARDDHQVETLTPELVAKVRENIQTVS